MLELVFERHFESTGDIRSVDFLVAIARDAGLKEEEVRQYLESGSGAQEVEDAVIRARADSVAHVPTVEINELRIEGADNPGEFYTALVGYKEGS